MKNKLTDLNNHLFMELERLGDESLDAEALETETKRAQAVSNIAKQIIANANLALDAARFNDEKLSVGTSLPKMLE